VTGSSLAENEAFLLTWSVEVTPKNPRFGRSIVSISTNKNCGPVAQDNP